MSRNQAKMLFYRTMATLEAAGVRPVRALRHEHPAGLRRPAHEIAAAVENGEGTIGELMARYPGVFSGFEANLVKAGEATGALDRVYRDLAEWFDLQVRLWGEIRTRLVYPAIVYHAAAILLPLISVFLDGRSAGAALRQGLTLVGTPWALWGAWRLWTRVATRLRPDRPTLLARLALAVPVVGLAIRKLDYARAYTALALALEAGMGVVAGLRLAAGTCANSALADQFRRVSLRVETGSETLSAALAEEAADTAADALVGTLMATGEESGSTPEMARRVAEVCQFEAHEALKRVAIIVPTACYLMLMLYLAYMIVQAWGKIMGQAAALTGG